MVDGLPVVREPGDQAEATEGFRGPASEVTWCCPSSALPSHRPAPFSAKDMTQRHEHLNGRLFGRHLRAQPPHPPGKRATGWNHGSPMLNTWPRHITLGSIPECDWPCWARALSLSCSSPTVSPYSTSKAQFRRYFLHELTNRKIMT